MTGFPPRRGRRRIVAGRVLDHGRPRNAQFLCYLGMRQAFRLELPDTLLNTHRCRHSFPPENHVWLLALGNLSGTVRHRRFSSADAVSSRRPCPI